MGHPGGSGNAGRTSPPTAWSDGDPVDCGDEVGLADVRVGDLIFVRAPRDRLGAVISELDGCAFSHVGVLDDGEVLLSARTDRNGGATADFGGIRRDPLRALVDRGLFVAPLVLSDDVRAAGLARLRGWSEGQSGPDRDSHSRFSYVKLVVVSAALAAIRRRRPLGIDAAEELWEATLEAAEVLAWKGEDPGFYCAEAVVAAYDLAFTVDALWVRDGEPHPAGLPARPGVRVPAGVGADGVLDLTDGSGPAPGAARPTAASRAALPDRLPSLGELWDAVTDLGFTLAQGRAVVDLLWTLWRYDPALAGRLLDSARDLKDPPKPGDLPHDPEPPPPGPFTAPPFVLGGAGRLHTALVTPRMLLSSAVVGSVHPLRV
jgi:hypothetical protein